MRILKKKVKYIGHIVSEEVIEIDKEKTEQVLDWPKPKRPEDIHRFLRLVGYYRRFIKKFSHIAKPLSELMQTPTYKNHRSKPKTKK